MATHTTICLGFRLYQTFLANCLIFSFDLSLMIINSPPALSPGKLWHHCSLKLNTDINGKKLTQDDKVTDLSCFCKKKFTSCHSLGRFQDTESLFYVKHERGSFNLLAKSTLLQLGQREEEVARTMSYTHQVEVGCQNRRILLPFLKGKNFRAMFLKIWLSARIRS